MTNVQLEAMHVQHNYALVSGMNRGQAKLIIHIESHACTQATRSTARARRCTTASARTHTHHATARARGGTRTILGRSMSRLSLRLGPLNPRMRVYACVCVYVCVRVCVCVCKCVVLCILCNTRVRRMYLLFVPVRYLTQHPHIVLCSELMTLVY